MVQEKAQEFATLLGGKEFTGWLARFKNRENLDFKNVVGEGGDFDVNVVQNWTENVLPSIFKDYAEDDIHNADETGLFYHMQPNKSIHFPDERCARGKQAKERLSILCCANMSGSDKVKLLAIGKSEKPRCFKNVKLLPISS